jgi:hypothetical protein
MRSRNKMLTTTITRAAFAEKMRQVAEEGCFVEYKRVNKYWSGRIAGVKLPTEMIFLVGASPYRFTAVSVDEVELVLIPEYARKIIAEVHDGEFVYAITCKPVIVARGPALAKQLQLTAFSSMPVPTEVRKDDSLQNM